MLGHSPKKIASLIALISAVGVMILSTYGHRYHYNSIQGISFVIMYFLAIKQERSNALLSVLTFIILGIFIREPIQSTESIRGVLFSLALIYFSNEKRRITPAFTLFGSWFLYFGLQVLPINIFSEITSGVFPIATSKTIELMLYEIIGLSFLEIISTSQSKNTDTLFGYQANLNLLVINLNSLIFFLLTRNLIFPNSSIELRSLANPSTALMISLLSELIIIVILSRKFSSSFENLFAHLELCSTPDSGFLTLSRKPALPIVEFVNYSKSIRKKSEALTSTRKKSTELKVELNALKRQIQETNEKNRDLNIMADSINIGLLAITSDGTITYVNRLFYEMLDLEISHAEMLHFKDLINKSTEPCEYVQSAIVEALGSGKSFKTRTSELSIEIVEWRHQEQNNRKTHNNLNIGNKRIFVFLKKINSDSKLNLISKSE